jgi:hypothetical protein
MKKFLACLIASALFFSSFATVPYIELPNLNANTVMIPVGHSGKTISLMHLAKINVHEFENLSGRKLNLVDEWGFKLGQKKLLKKINADGTIKSASLKKYAAKMSDGETGFHLGGFALGFLLGAIGVIIAYVINDDYKSNRVKWAWIGFGTYVVIALAVILALASASTI